MATSRSTQSNRSKSRGCSYPSDPQYFYTLGYRLAEAYGLNELSFDPNKSGKMAWFAHYKLPEQIEVFPDHIIIRCEAGTHKLVIAEDDPWLKEKSSSAEP